MFAKFSTRIKLTGLIVFKRKLWEVHIGKYWSPVQNDLKQGDALVPLLFNIALE